MLILGRRSHLETSLPGWRFSSYQEDRRSNHKDSGDPICFPQFCSSGALDTQIYILRSGMELETDNKPKLNYVTFILSWDTHRDCQRDITEQGWGFERAWKRGQMDSPYFYSNQVLEGTLQNTVKCQPLSSTSSSSVRANLRAAGFAVGLWTLRKKSLKLKWWGLRWEENKGGPLAWLCEDSGESWAKRTEWMEAEREGRTSCALSAQISLRLLWGGCNLMPGVPKTVWAKQ